MKHLRGVIEREEAILHRRISVLVYKVCGALRPAEVADRAQEILNEAVSRGLQNAAKFEMGRSATAWLMGIALHVLQEQLRGRARRAVVQSDLGDAAWRQALQGLCTVDSDAAMIRLDIRQALARLDEPQRRVVELRYFKGLDGEELARALGAPTAGAARVRLTRALQALRTQFGLTEGEVTP
ncbi:MAG: sigma-70 family RNA polymerase sigma factor [Thermomicrobiales bacterium]